MSEPQQPDYLGALRALRDKVLSPHEHDWRVVDTWQQESRQPIHPLSPLATPSTFVLMVCQGCHVPQSIELEGKWTIEQVRSRSEQQ